MRRSLAGEIAEWFAGITTDRQAGRITGLADAISELQYAGPTSREVESLVNRAHLINVRSGRACGCGQKKKCGVSPTLPGSVEPSFDDDDDERATTDERCSNFPAGCDVSDLTDHIRAALEAEAATLRGLGFGARVALHAKQPCVGYVGLAVTRPEDWWLRCLGVDLGHDDVQEWRGDATIRDEHDQLVGAIRATPISGTGEDPDFVMDIVQAGIDRLRQELAI